MDQYSYDIKIRPRAAGVTYVWGGPDLLKPLLAQLYLICRVDDLGEQVQIKVKTSTSPIEIDYGKLGPSQTLVLPLNDGVYVSAVPVANQGDSRLTCAVVK